MGMASASKAERILANAQRVVAAELLCAAQGLEFLKPLGTGPWGGGLVQSPACTRTPLCRDSRPTVHRPRTWNGWPIAVAQGKLDAESTS